jgi:cold shock CspA family protein
MKGRIQTYHQHRGFGFIIDSAGDKRFFHIRQVKNSVDIEEGVEVEFDPTTHGKGKVAINVTIIAPILPVVRLTPNEIYDYFMIHINQFKHFVERTSRILKPIPKVNYEYIQSKTETLNKKTGLYIYETFKDPKVEIQTLINDNKYTVGYYQPEIEYIIEPSYPGYKTEVEHTYSCDVLTHPVVISTALSHQKLENWEAFIKAVEVRIREVEECVTGQNPYYLEKLKRHEYYIKTKVKEYFDKR